MFSCCHKRPLQFRHWTSDLRHQTILDRELTLEVFSRPFFVGPFPFIFSFSLMSEVYGLLLSESRKSPLLQSSSKIDSRFYKGYNAFASIESAA
jgi:hypothetical protein